MIKTINKIFLFSNLKSNIFLFLIVLICSLGFLINTFFYKDKNFIINEIVFNYGQFDYSLRDMKKLFIIEDEVYEIDAMIDNLLVYQLGNQSTNQNLNIILTKPDEDDDTKKTLFDLKTFNSKNFLKSIVLNTNKDNSIFEKFNKVFTYSDTFKVHRSIEFVGNDEDYFIRLLFEGNEKMTLEAYFNKFLIFLFDTLGEQITQSYLVKLETVISDNNELIKILNDKIDHYKKFALTDEVVSDSLELYHNLLQDLNNRNKKIMNQTDKEFNKNFNLSLNYSYNTIDNQAIEDNSRKIFTFIVFIFLNLFTFGFFSTFNFKNLKKR